MSDIPEMVEIVRFVCSACGKRSTSVAKKEKMTCKNCQEVYERRNGEWMPARYWKGKKNDIRKVHRSP